MLICGVADLVFVLELDSIRFGFVMQAGRLVRLLLPRVYSRWMLAVLAALSIWSGGDVGIRVISSPLGFSVCSRAFNCFLLFHCGQSQKKAKYDQGTSITRGCIQLRIKDKDVIRNEIIQKARLCRLFHDQKILKHRYDKTIALQQMLRVSPGVSKNVPETLPTMSTRVGMTANARQ